MNNLLTFKYYKNVPWRSNNCCLFYFLESIYASTSHYNGLGQEKMSIILKPVKPTCRFVFLPLCLLFSINSLTCVYNFIDYTLGLLRNKLTNANDRAKKNCGNCGRSRRSSILLNIISCDIMQKSRPLCMRAHSRARRKNERNRLFALCWQ